VASTTRSESHKVRKRASLGLRRHAQRPPYRRPPLLQEHALQRRVVLLLFLKYRDAAVVVRSDVLFQTLKGNKTTDKRAQRSSSVAMLCKR
jgi:hypothetical protein